MTSTITNAATKNTMLAATTTTTTTTMPPSLGLQEAAEGSSSFWAGAMVMDDITQTKLIASLVLFVITLLFGYVPVRCILNQNYIQHAMFAGGGVLMATAFCHLIPEAHDGYKNANGGDDHLHAHHHNHNHNHNDPLVDEEHHHQHNNNSVIHQINETIATLNETGNNDSFSITNSQQQQQQHLVHSHNTPLYVPYPEVALCCGFIFMYVVEQLFLRFVNNHTHEHPGGDTSTGQLIGSQPKGAASSGGATGGGSRAGGELEADQRDSASVVVLDGGSITELPMASHPSKGSSSATTGALYKFIRGLLIVSAFSLHSIFDGVAIGSQDSIEKVWTIFFAISCHKLIIVAVVGFELFSATLESHLWTLVHLTIFSIMSPIGILLVVIAQNSLKISSDDPAIILLQSFATGTLLYIIFVEILQPKEDRFHARNRSTKILSLILGFGAMVTILTFMHGD